MSGPTTEGRRLAGNLGWSFGADVAARGASFGLTAYCARLLPVADFGLFALVQSIAQYVWLLADGAANSSYALREVARSRGAGSPAAALFMARLVAGIVLAGAYLALVLMLPLAPEKRMALAAASVFFVAYASFPDWLARGLENFRALAFAQWVMALGLAASCVLVLPRYPNPAAAVAVWGGSFLIGGAVLLPILARKVDLGRWDMRSLGRGKRLLTSSIIFWLGGLGAMGITYLPTILLGALATAEELAQFAAALRIVTVCVGLGAVAWWPFYSTMSASPPDSLAFREAFRAFLRIMLGTSLVLALALWLFAGVVIPALFGARYTEAVLLLRWLVWTIPLYFLISVLEIATLATGGELRRAQAHGIAVAVLVASSAVLIPAMGPRGAVLGLTAGLATASVGFLLILRRRVAPEPWTWWLARPRSSAPPEPVA